MKFKVMNCSANDAAYIPFGTLAFVTSDNPDELVTFSVVPWITSKSKQGLDNEAVSLINHSMNKFAKNQSDKPTWQKIAEKLSEAD